jgi:protein-disulfide isomerase
LLKKYPNQIKIVYKHFPIRSHKYAFKAAEASLAAERQGKFWEFHDALFKKYNQLSDQTIQKIIDRLNLDPVKFEAAGKDPAIAKKIKQDYQEGLQLGLRGVPTVFINGKKLRDRKMESFVTEIEKELKSRRPGSTQ